MPMNEDPLKRRLRDRDFARAYRSWVRLLVDRARHRGSTRRVVRLPKGESLRPPKSLAG